MINPLEPNPRPHLWGTWTLWETDVHPNEGHPTARNGNQALSRGLGCKGRMASVKKINGSPAAYPFSHCVRPPTTQVFGEPTTSEVHLLEANKRVWPKQKGTMLCRLQFG